MTEVNNNVTTTKEYFPKHVFKPEENEFHPLANICPMISEAEVRELARDIKKNGQLERIKMFEGKILDGRSRYWACLMADEKPETEEFVGTHQEALSYVMSLNAHRRHMDESQRAFAAAKLVKASTQICAVTQEQAARMFNVSLRSVSSAFCILTRGHQFLIDEVEQGRIPVSTASHIVYLDLIQQDTFFRLGNETRKQAMKAIVEFSKSPKCAEHITKVKRVIEQDEVSIEFTKDEKETVNATMTLIGELDKSAFVKKVFLKQCLLIQKTSEAIAVTQESMRNSKNTPEKAEAIKAIRDYKEEDEKWLRRLAENKSNSNTPASKQIKAK